MQTVAFNSNCNDGSPEARRLDLRRLAEVLTVLVFLSAGSLPAQETDGNKTTVSLPERWPHAQRVQLPAEADSPWVDVVVPGSVFSGARVDLGDVRLLDRAGEEISYALRAQPISESIRATQFNRVVGPGNSTEVTLDLQSSTMQHNEIEVQMPGANFRRQARLEGSDDGEQWRTLVEKKNLIRFQRDGGELKDCRLTYAQSRFRFLRLRISPDPQVDKSPVPINGVTVQRKIEVLGEMYTLEGKLGKRAPVPANGVPGSAWVIDLDGDNIPCSQIEVQIGDSELVRDYYIEAGGPPDPRKRFHRIGGGRWQRRAGEEPTAMVAEFGETRASRLRLVVTDHGNPPLDVRSVKVSGAARQIVFETPEKPGEVAYLAYGNPKAEAPHYDFAANLPAKLEPPPARARLGPQEENPAYVPEPLPLTERWPWAIYVVLGSISVLLAAVIFSVARSAIAIHDAARPQPDHVESR